tara:strand:+ start:381 stop:542 length:162 start_codon:yes stop_codon:yes gene_type:complete
MLKKDLIELLTIIERECKRGCEQSYYEEHRDKWGEYHEIIRNFILELKNGTFK